MKVMCIKDCNGVSVGRDDYSDKVEYLQGWNASFEADAVYTAEIHQSCVIRQRAVQAEFWVEVVDGTMDALDRIQGFRFYSDKAFNEYFRVIEED